MAVSVIVFVCVRQTFLKFCTCYRYTNKTKPKIPSSEPSLQATNHSHPPTPNPRPQHSTSQQALFLSLSLIPTTPVTPYLILTPVHILHSYNTHSCTQPPAHFPHQTLYPSMPKHNLFVSSDLLLPISNEKFLSVLCSLPDCAVDPIGVERGQHVVRNFS
jgi:hypothetical protein